MGKEGEGLIQLPEDIKKDISWVRGCFWLLLLAFLVYATWFLKNLIMWKMGKEIDLMPPIPTESILLLLVSGALGWHIILVKMGLKWRKEEEDEKTNTHWHTDSTS